MSFTLSTFGLELHTIPRLTDCPTTFVLMHMALFQFTITITIKSNTGRLATTIFARSLHRIFGTLESVNNNQGQYPWYQGIGYHFAVPYLNRMWAIYHSEWGRVKRRQLPAGSAARNQSQHTKASPAKSSVCFSKGCAAQDNDGLCRNILY